MAETLFGLFLDILKYAIRVFFILLLFCFKLPVILGNGFPTNLVSTEGALYLSDLSQNWSDWANDCICLN